MAESAEVEQQLKECTDKLEALQKSLDESRNAAASHGAVGTAAASVEEGKIDADFKLLPRKKYQPDAKVSDLSWWPLDSEHICSVLQDGKIIIWNAKSGQKAYFVSQNTWLMSGDFSHDGKQLAVAGLDNIVTIHQIPDVRNPGDFQAAPPNNQQKLKCMENHAGYIGAVKWLDNNTVISGSGDKTIMLWDIGLDVSTQKKPQSTFIGHGMVNTDTGDVAALDTFKGESNTFISGASDSYAKLWDKRAISDNNNGCVMTFTGHTDIINKIKYLPNGKSFITASEDGLCKVFDLRSNLVLQTFDDGEKSKASAIACSQSGRYITAGYHNGMIKCWDMLNPDKDPVELDHHSAAVTAIELSSDGKAFASCSRDSSVNFAVWA